MKGTLRVMQQAQTVYVLPAGKPHWEAAGVANKIDLRIAPAADTLSALLKVDSAPALDITCSSLDFTLCGRFTVSEGLSGTSVLHDEPDTHALRYQFVFRSLWQVPDVDLTGRTGGRFRHGVHRCRQGQLRHLLRAVFGTAAARRRHCGASLLSQLLAPDFWVLISQRQCVPACNHALL